MPALPVSGVTLAQPRAPLDQKDLVSSGRKLPVQGLRPVRGDRHPPHPTPTHRWGQSPFQCWFSGWLLWSSRQGEPDLGSGANGEGCQSRPTPQPRADECWGCK